MPDSFTTALSVRRPAHASQRGPVSSRQRMSTCGVFGPGPPLSGARLRYPKRPHADSHQHIQRPLRGGDKTPGCKTSKYESSRGIDIKGGPGPVSARYKMDAVLGKPRFPAKPPVASARAGSWPPFGRGQSWDASLASTHRSGCSLSGVTWLRPEGSYGDPGPASETQ